MRPRSARRVRAWLLLAAFGFLVAAGALTAGRAHADPDPRCQQIPWGFLWTQRRVICDGPIQMDGHWERGRVIYTPAHQVPMTCYGSYVVTCYGGYWVDKVINDATQYPVTNDTVLPDEPAHLGGGIVQGTIS